MTVLLTARRWAEICILGAQIALAAVVFGVPDFSAAYRLVREGYPQGAGTLALGEIIVWASVIAIAAGGAVAALRGRRRPDQRRQSRRAPWAIVALGAMCLTVGAVRHAQATYSPCCGSPQQAEHALEAVP